MSLPQTRNPNAGHKTHVQMIIQVPVTFFLGLPPSMAARVESYAERMHDQLHTPGRREAELTGQEVQGRVSLQLTRWGSMHLDAFLLRARVSVSCRNSVSSSDTEMKKLTCQVDRVCGERRNQENQRFEFLRWPDSLEMTTRAGLEANRWDI